MASPAAPQHPHRQRAESSTPGAAGPSQPAEAPGQVPPHSSLGTVEKQLRHWSAFRARCLSLWKADQAAGNEKASRSPTARAALCSTDALLWFPEGRAPIAIAMRCKRKWCPVCSELWAGHLLRETLEALERTDVRPRQLRHIVLTLPNAPAGELRPRIAQLYSSFREWRNQGRRSHTGFFWEALKGYTAKLEITHSPRAGWHPHIHVLAHAPKGFDATRHSPAREAWTRITSARGVAASLAHGLFVTAPHDSRDAAREVAKYAAKPYDVSGLSSKDLRELSTATHGTRFSSSQGTLAARSPEESRLGRPQHTLSELYHKVTSHDTPNDLRTIALAQLHAALLECSKNPALASRIPQHAWEV